MKTRRGFTLVIVLAALSVVTAVLLAIQSTGFRQASAGRETLARVRAHWAARAGIETAMARIERNLEAGSSGSAFTMSDDLAAASGGELAGATWSVAHTRGEGENAEPRDGAEDPHAKININSMAAQDLLQLEGMTEDMVDSILDWIDEDDAPNPLGAEEGYYTQLPSPYEPRNGPMTSLFELELVAGITPELVRGEDWNLNGVLDANEDDADASWPPDDADGSLDAGWSAVVTASSFEPRWGASGQARLDLSGTTSEELVARVPSLDPAQATVILDYGSRGGGVRLEDLVSTTLSTIAQQSGGGLPTTVRDLRDDQLVELFDECFIGEGTDQPTPGRINLNTVSRDTLDYLTAIPAGFADALILARDAAPQGFVNMMDLLEIPAMTPRRLRQLSVYVSVESGAYVVSSRGKDSATGIEAQIVCTVSAGTLPAAIVEKRVR